MYSNETIVLVLKEQPLHRKKIRMSVLNMGIDYALLNGSNT